MKVLMVTPYFLPHIGGMEIFVYKLCNRLYEKGIDVEVLTTAIPREYNIDTPYRVDRVKPEAVIMRNPIVFGVFKKIKNKKFDIVHVHDEHAFVTNIVAFSKKAFRNPLIIHSHGLFYPENFLESIVITLYNNTLGKWSLERADKVIALSRNDGKFIEKLGIEGDRIEIIPNAIDPTDYNTNIYIDDFLEEYEVSDKKIILYVGAIIKRKGLNFLIEAISLMRNKDNVKLVVIGEGSFKKKCQGMVRRLNLEGNIIFLGRIPREKLLKAFKAADVLVLPSLVEGVPTVILEALIYRKPVVAFDIPEIREYFEDSVYLVPPKDVNMLAKAIDKVLEDPKAILKNISRGERVLRENFLWEVVIDKIIRVYEELLSH